MEGVQGREGYDPPNPNAEPATVPCCRKGRKLGKQGREAQASGLPNPPLRRHRRRRRALIEGQETRPARTTRARATSHIDALAPDHAATVMHRRLHVSLDRIKKLVANTVDSPLSQKLYTPTAMTS